MFSINWDECVPPTTEEVCGRRTGRRSGDLNGRVIIYGVTHTKYWELINWEKCGWQQV